MNESILNLAPKGIWEEFHGILGVPRPSKREAKMVAYLEKWANNHKVSYIKEECGNITGWISYTYSRTFRTIEDINFGKEYRSPYDRPHNIVLVANYDFTPRISVAANWIYNTGQPVTYPYGQCTVGGVTYAIYNGSRNESRYPAYHRMDISATFKLGKPRWKKWESELNVSVYNAYAHHNTWAITFGQNPDGGIATKKMYLFSTVPSISYNFKF